MDGMYIPIMSELYLWLLLGLALARGSDFGSTYLATPGLKLEANPVAAWLGWKRGIILNVVMCVIAAMYLVPAVMLMTTSFLVAARNLEHAWLMRTMGEFGYQSFMAARLGEARFGMVLGCYWGSSLLFFIVGLAIVLTGGTLVVQSIGFGIIGYAFAVVLFTTLSLWRSQRKYRYDASLSKDE